MIQIVKKFIDRSNNGNNHQLQACREFKSMTATLPSKTSSEYESAIFQYQTHVFNL